MKKIIIIGIFIFLMFVCATIGKSVYAASLSLDEIANKFNNCNTVKEYAEMESVLKATVNGNKLNISVTSNGQTLNFEYTLTDTILSATFSDDDEQNGVQVATIIADCVGQLHGYSDGDLLDTLNSEKITDYTVLNEGYEIKEISNNNYQVKIDISKKIPLIGGTTDKSTDKSEDENISSNATETIDDENEEADLSAMPKTGEKSKTLLNILYIVIFLASIGVISLIKKKNK